MNIINNVRQVGGCAYEYFNNQSSQKEVQDTVYRAVSQFFFTWGRGVQTPLVANPRIDRALAPSNISSDTNFLKKFAQISLNHARFGVKIADKISTSLGKHTFLKLNSVLGFFPGGTGISAGVSSIARVATFIALSVISLMTVGVEMTTKVALKVALIASVTLIIASVTLIGLVTSPIWIIPVCIANHLKKAKIEDLSKENIQLQQEVRVLQLKPPHQSREVEEVFYDAAESNAALAT